jgi:hypothetical protein
MRLAEENAMKIKKSLSFKTLVLGHLGVFVPLAIVQAAVCLLGGALSAPSEIQLPLGFSCSPPAEHMTGAQGAVFAMVLFPLTGLLLGFSAWFFTSTGMWVLGRLPRVEVV